ncbi:MAG: prepilin-type N-terminal cleavage/methylation domain-containing protein [Deltaproteobacteria bacterium]|nr:prepilin-type N-terminal cleavage/methylation domain-containing protein [Deltaproteobacteria bacterium]
MNITRNQKGFTLLEIIIAIGILAGMTLIISETIEGVMLTRKRTERKNETRHAVSIALAKMMDDLRTAFQAHQKFTGNADYYLTGFVGDTSSMNFSTMGNVHYVKNHKDTDQVQVGYSLEGNTRGSFDLVRRQTDHLTDKLDSGGKSFVLLPNVREFNLEYYDSNKESWEGQWDTESVSSAGRLPQVVKINMVVLGEPTNADEDEFKEYTYELWAPIEMYANKINF